MGQLTSYFLYIFGKKILAFSGLLYIKLTFLPNMSLLVWAFVAIGIDLITGLVKAKINKVARTSQGMRKTIIKFMQYGGAIAISFVLVNVSKNETSGIKYVSDGLIMLIIYIEALSVFENLYAIDKKSPFSKYFIKPALSILSLGIEKTAPQVTEEDLKKEADRKDAIRRFPPDAITAIAAIIIAACMFTSCSPKITASESHIVTDTTTVKYKPVEVKIKGSSVTGELNVDSLLNALKTNLQKLNETNFSNEKTIAQQAIDFEKVFTDFKKGIKPSTPVVITDTSGRVQLKYWYDSFGKLQMECGTKDQTINLLVAEITRMRNEINSKQTVIYRTRPVWLTWLFMGMALIQAVVLYLIVKRNGRVI